MDTTPENKDWRKWTDDDLVNKFVKADNSNSNGWSFKDSVLDSYRNDAEEIKSRIRRIGNTKIVNSIPPVDSNGIPLPSAGGNQSPGAGGSMNIDNNSNITNVLRPGTQPPNTLTPFSASASSSSNAEEPDYGDISSQQLEVSNLSEKVYANHEIEAELIKIIKQLNRLISANQVKINNINSQIPNKETGLAATSIDVRRMAQNVAAYTAMTIYYGVLLNEIQRQLQQRLRRNLSEDVLKDLAASKKKIGDIQQIFENLRTQEIIKLTSAEWSELQRVIENFIKRKENQRWLMQELKSFWETVRDTSIERGSAALASISSAVTPFVRPAGVAVAGRTALQTATYMSMGGELVLYVPPTTSITSVIKYVPAPLLRIYRFLISSNYYVVRFMAGGTRLVITNPILSISVVSLLAIYATLPSYAKNRIRGAIVFLLRLIFIQTPTVGLNMVMMIFNSIVLPLWKIINWLVAAPGQAVMALFNLFSFPSNMTWDTMTRWVAGMWSYITNSPIVSLAGSMITSSSISSSSRSSSDDAAQRAELATILTSQLAAIPESPSSNSSNAASSSSAQATTTGFEAASFPTQADAAEFQKASDPTKGFTVTASSVGDNRQETPLENLTFISPPIENAAADAAISETVDSLNKNSTEEQVNEATSSITKRLEPPASVEPTPPTSDQLTGTTETLVKAVVNAGDEDIVDHIKTVSRNPTPANSQLADEPEISPKDATTIAQTALATLNNLDAVGKRYREDENKNIGGRRKSRRRRTRSTKKRPIRRRRNTKRRGTRKRQRRYTKKRRGLRRR